MLVLSILQWYLFQGNNLLRFMVLRLQHNPKSSFSYFAYHIVAFHCLLFHLWEFVRGEEEGERREGMMEDMVGMSDI